ncbi:MAG: hypothetical protein ACXWV1_04260, partial [Chitinophagaceae bacterium]
IYLGGHVPLKSLIGAVNDTAPQNLLFFLVHHDSPDETGRYLDKLSDAFKGKKIYAAAGGALTQVPDTRRKIQFLQSVEDLEQLL